MTIVKSRGTWHSNQVRELVLSATGVAAIMGFGVTPHTIVSYFGLTGSAGAGLSGVVRTLSGWFLLQVFASMVFGLGGGYIAASRSRAGAETAAAVGVAGAGGTRLSYRHRRGAAPS